MRLCICGEPIPRRAKKGGQEKQYCSDKCKQRAYRERNHTRFLIEKQIREDHKYPLGPVELDLQYEIDRFREENGRLRFELMMVTEHELPAKEREIDELEKKLRYALLHDDYLSRLLAERDAEITRLTILLESHSKRQR